MTELLKKYYDTREWYRVRAENNPNRTPDEQWASCKELGDKLYDLIEQMNYEEIKYLYDKSRSFERMKLYKYLKKFEDAKQEKPQEDDIPSIKKQSALYDKDEI